jgi:hypothetical protein
VEERQRLDIESIEDSDYFQKLVLAGFSAAFAVFLVFLAWPVTQVAISIHTAPFLRATALITSKDSDQSLSVKSADLPKGGDVIFVDRFVYGAVAPGDSVCLQYKLIPDDSQYGTEFVNFQYLGETHV